MPLREAAAGLDVETPAYAELMRWAASPAGGLNERFAATLTLFRRAQSGDGEFADRIVRFWSGELRAKETPEADELAGLAEAGMRMIERDMVLLAPAGRAMLDCAYRDVKALHAEAFGWDPPNVPGLERLGATRMRQYIRAWVNEWDLVRLDPNFTSRTETGEIATDYREDAELDGEVDPGSGAWE